MSTRGLVLGCGRSEGERKRLVLMSRKLSLQGARVWLQREFGSTEVGFGRVRRRG